ncbi:glycosyltransferase [Paucibacter sp. APW11]|uniref:Glycosyltransferase n=1 Tax=Roseateles aquae TaxID=3077235 RepID=A0ABU3PGW3_9BURK|nr:glycosyltransferase [Paucibacter sp. APW11]MDT9001261.1 glycosyltransferase [Paucibacter sp. APW11]
MKIGILGHGFIEWGGGLDFLRLICGSLASAAPEAELHLLLPTKGPRLAAREALRAVKRGLKRAIGLPAIRAKTPDVRHIAELIKGSATTLYAHEIDAGLGAIEAAARRLQLDVVLPCVQPMRGSQLPWIGYIADFQHTHLPHFFSADEIARRDANFADMLKSAACVIVNAEAVAADIAAFSPDCRAKIVALPFSAAPNPQWLQADEAPLAKYDITAPYFIISNQFWQHKDHRCAYRAFAQLTRQHQDVQLVCTGETSDFRNPDHFKQLCEEARLLGIESRLKVLGLIPKREQIALMKQAVAVVQPTLFEGGPGGGSVFDAVALGIPAIVSDVAVNREIREDTVFFFEAGNADSLAMAMAEQLRNPVKVRKTTAELISAGLARRQACGKALLRACTAVQEAMGPSANLKS